MTTIKITTQKAQNFIESYRKSNIIGIFQAYIKPSDAKIAAYANIVRRAMTQKTVTPVYIISAGTQYFTTAYEGVYNDKIGLIVDTKCNTYFIPYED